MIEISKRRLVNFIPAQLLRWPWCQLSKWLAKERDRWFLWYVTFFGCGIITYFVLPFEPNFLSVLLPLIAARLLAYVWQQGTIAQFLPSILLALATGLGCAKIEAMLVEAPILQRKIFQAVVKGHIERIEPRLERGPRITIRVANISGLPKQQTPHRIRIRLIKDDKALRPGVAIEIKATLTPPMRPSLPGGYDFARGAFFQRIGAFGYALGMPRPAVLPKLPWDLQIKTTIQSIRQYLGAKITAAAPGERGAIANALMTGERGLISSATLTAYRDAGLLHVLSISGLHMAIMAGTVFFVIRLALSMWPFITLRYSVKKWAAVSSIGAAATYLLISGATHATQRAFVMVLIMMCAIMLDRPAIALRNVAIAATALLILAPSSLLNVGFQMSFAAVIALVAAYEYMRNQRSLQPPGIPRGAIVGTILFFAGIIGSTVIASLAVAPIAAYHFHKGQLYGVLANLIAVPICNFLVMPAALLSFIAMPFGLEAIPLWLMVQGIDVMTWCARTVAGLPGAVMRIPAFSELSFALMIFGALWLCIWRENWRFWGIVLIAFGICVAPWRSWPDVLIAEGGKLVAVRQADGRLVATPGHRKTFEFTQWLEHEGDLRPTTVVNKNHSFKCDPIGCTIKYQSFFIAISKSPASLVDDCRRAHLLILSYPKPTACHPTAGTIDFWQLRNGGTHAITINKDNSLNITRVKDQRGNRPWTQYNTKSLKP